MAWDGAALRIKDAEDRGALMEIEKLEKVSMAEVENAAALASARQDVEGFVYKITLLEDKPVVKHQIQEVSERDRQAQFEEPTLLQTWYSDMCHAIIDPPRARHHLSKGMQLPALRHTEMARECHTHLFKFYISN
jgi:hypothetical protein